MLEQNRWLTNLPAVALLAVALALPITAAADNGRGNGNGNGNGGNSQSAQAQAHAQAQGPKQDALLPAQPEQQTAAQSSGDQQPPGQLKKDPSPATQQSSAAPVNPGAGSTQGQFMGNSHSNPDARRAGSIGQGVDKPFTSDGRVAESQSYGSSSIFDGNNGCGQDKHAHEVRETDTVHLGYDDNNGWCGKPPTVQTQIVETAGVTATSPANNNNTTNAETTNNSVTNNTETDNIVVNNTTTNNTSESNTSTITAATETAGAVNLPPQASARAVEVHTELAEVAGVQVRGPAAEVAAEVAGVTVPAPAVVAGASAVAAPAPAAAATQREQGVEVAGVESPAASFLPSTGQPTLDLALLALLPGSLAGAGLAIARLAGRRRV